MDTGEVYETLTSLIKSSLENGGRAFATVYGLRVGLSLVGRVFGLARVGDWRALLSLEKLVGEQHLTARVESVRWALACGVFVAVYRLVRDVSYKNRRALARVLARLLPQAMQLPEPHSETERKFREMAMATSLAGLTSSAAAGACLPRETRRWLSLLAFARACQAVYNEMKLRNAWSLFPPIVVEGDRRPAKTMAAAAAVDGAPVDPFHPASADQLVQRQSPFGGHGDTLLFMLTTAQVMFAYAMMPDTLPPSYYSFIVRTGPLEEPVLQSVRTAWRGRPLDLDQIEGYFTQRNGVLTHGAAALAAVHAGTTLIPCSVLHPHTTRCSSAALDTLTGAARRVVPVYLSVFTLGQLWSWRRSVRQPGAALASVALNTARSSAFMGLFNALCMAQLCSSRRFLARESALNVYALSFVAAMAVLIEKRSRRAELALYVLPRALDSAWLALRRARLVPRRVPGGAELLLAVSAATCMTAHEMRSGHMSSFVHGALSLVFRRVPKMKDYHCEDDDVAQQSLPS